MCAWRYHIPTARERMVAERIKLRREELGLTRRHIGAALKVRGTTIENYETCRSIISKARLKQLAKVLGVKPSYFDPRKPIEARTVPDGIGERLRARRKELRLSLGAVSVGMGCSIAAIHAYETGKSRPSVPKLERLAEQLCMSVDDMFGAP